MLEQCTRRLRRPFHTTLERRIGAGSDEQPTPDVQPTRERGAHGKPTTHVNASRVCAALDRLSGGSVIVTFKVVDEQYRVLVTDPANVAIVNDLLDGGEGPRIPNGEVAPGDGGVNGPWTWHIDPATLEFADMTTEVCDGKPSFVEDGLVSGDRFCPWSAKVISVEPATP